MSSGSHAAVPPGQGTQATAATGADVSAASVGELITAISRDLSTLMRQEIELAKAELRQEATKTGKGAGLLAGAGFAGYMVLLFASLAAWWGLSNVMDQGWAALIVTAVWALAGTVLVVVGRGQLRAVHPKPERTVDTLQQVPDALKGR
jgi:Putative Actinobacterial Holin-X, holin superfamily III